jgi:sortase A
MSWVGALLVVGGVVVLGYVGWQYWGTTWVAQREHRVGVDRLERAWEEGREAVDVDHGRATAIVRIPRFGAEYAVPLLEGTSDEVLAAGFGRYDGSAAPGEVGNLALAGHRVTHGEPLKGMPDLVPGDEVVVETASATYTYVLDTGGADLEVDFSETWVLDDRPRNPDGGVGPAPEARLLTLTTCAELFHTDERLVAFGHLASVEPRAQASR